MISLITEGYPGWSDNMGLLLPGAHVAVFTPSPESGIEGRRAGLELRDTLAVLRAGPVTTFVLLFRKPVTEGTVADQVALTGTGALNVNGCRVAADLSEFFSATGKRRSGAGHAKGYGMEGTFGGDAANPPHADGRWPSNLVIVHGPGCRPVGTKRVRASGGHYDKPRIAGATDAQDDYTRNKMRQSTIDHADKDGLETVAAYECCTGCPSPFLDAMSGPSTSRAGKPRGSAVPGQGWGMTRTGAEYNDHGGASRFYPQFGNDAELYAWIVRLINPEPV